MKSEEWICTKEKYLLLNYGGKNMMIRPFVGGLGVLLTIEQQDNLSCRVPPANALSKVNMGQFHRLLFAKCICAGTHCWVQICQSVSPTELRY